MTGAMDLAAPPSCPATLCADAATRITWDVVVVGAGPAGSAAAIRLAARGLGVLLLDAAAMPRAKLCGCCLSSEAVGEARRLGRLSGVDPLGLSLPLTRVRLVSAGNSTVLPLPGGAVLSREAFDTALVRAATSVGAAWMPHTRVVACSEAGRGVTLQARCRDSAGLLPLRSRLVVLATGLHAPLGVGRGRAARTTAPGSRVGVGTTLPPIAGAPPPGQLVMAIARGGYCGVVRLEDGRIDVAAAVDRRALAMPGGAPALLGGLLGRALDEPAPDLVGLLATATFRGAPPLTHASQPVAGAAGRILRIGDAAGYVEPFTGEGIGWALAGARLLDESLGEGRSPGMPEDMVAAARRHAAAWRRHFDGRHARCRRVTRLVRRPTVVACAAGLARLAPPLAARLVPLVVGRRTPGGPPP